MQAKNKQTTLKLGSIVISTMLLTSCGAGSGDQNQVSNLPEVAQATQAPTSSATPSAPEQPVTTDVANTTAGTPLTPTITTEPETQQTQVVVPEVNVVPDSQIEVATESNTGTDSDSNGIDVIDIGIGIPIEPEIIIIEQEVVEENQTAEETGPEVTDETAGNTATEPEPEPSEPLLNVACTAPQSDIQTSTLRLINDARAVERMCGGVLFEATTPLTWNTKLEDAAKIHSTDMSQNNFFSHDGSDGSTIAQRADAQQYDWRSIGENIAAGQQTTESVIQAWLDSPGHCANLMNPNFQETAVVCVENTSAQYRQYWTNVLGTSF